MDTSKQNRDKWMRLQNKTWGDTCIHSQSLSCVQPFATPEIVVHQAPPWNFSDKNPEVGCHFLLQKIFLTYGLNLHLLCLLYGQVDSLPLSHLRSLGRYTCMIQLKQGKEMLFKIPGKNIEVGCHFLL